MSLRESLCLAVASQLEFRYSPIDPHASFRACDANYHVLVSYAEHEEQFILRAVDFQPGSIAQNAAALRCFLEEGYENMGYRSWCERFGYEENDQSVDRYHQASQNFLSMRELIRDEDDFRLVRQLFTHVGRY